ncbi:exonuclease SbcCD subunit D [Candidatus Woesearchaeota archaeon]|nr:exonuclease SbcCD subunit D [Candidatus Woesearchaeota archaeon]
MRFAHLADAHIGVWRDPKMASLPDQAFEQAVSAALAENVDFIVIAGDLFNTALPGIDHLRAAVRTLQRAKEASVPVYVIPGSHDFSPSGKSMLHVLEEAGLLIDVFKGDIEDGKLRLRVTKDEKTGCAIAGILGRKGMLEREHYDDLDVEDLQAKVSGAKRKIFLFHTAITELRPKELSMMDSSPMSMLPPGFDYYAGGHVHVVGKVSLEGYEHVVYPGPVFPASFSELEKLGNGNMVIVEDRTPRDVPLVLKRVVPVKVVAEDSTPEQVTERLLAEIREVKDAIVLLRVKGSLTQGGTGDIDFRRVFRSCYDKGAYFVMRNTAGLVQERGDAQEVTPSSADRIEEDIFKEYAGKVSSRFGEREVGVAKSLLQSMSSEKAEGETNAAYEDRIVGEARRVLGLEDAE